MPTGPQLADTAWQRGERWWLAAVVLVTLLVQMACADAWLLGFDEAWHVFQATVQPWLQHLREIRREAHPPLLYACLRLLCWPTDSTLLPRLPGIVAGVAPPTGRGARTR